MIAAFLSALLLFFAVKPSQLPFTIEAVEDVSNQFPDAPRIQSFCFAQWKGRWIFIGGRTIGYHNFGGRSADFLRKDANTEVWVIDTTVSPARTYHAPLADLPSSFTSVKDQWSASGLLYAQNGSTLYIAGGYGQDHLSNWVTYPLLSRVSLPALIDGIMHGRLNASSISFVSTPLAQSAGGDLAMLQDGLLYLVMGQVFTGSYTALEGNGEKNSAQASQEYLGEIRVLKITGTEKGSLAVKLLKRYSDPIEFHRRDLNVSLIQSPKGLGLVSYGGVFTPDTQLSYSHPILLYPGAKPVVETTFEQKMNAYTCPQVLLYDQKNTTMFTSFLGGISRYFWDDAKEKFVANTREGSKTESTYLDGMQWSNQISTLTRQFTTDSEDITETVQPKALPAFVGTSAVFIPDPAIARATPGTDILDWNALHSNALQQKSTPIGYLFGGIRAYPYQFPYNKSGRAYNSGAVPTKQNDLILKVYLNPTH